MTTPQQPSDPSQPWTPPSQQPPPGPRRLTRSTTDSRVSGVCGGIADYLGLDATVVRVLAVLAIVLTFPVGLVVYAVLWAIVPKE